MKKLVFFVVVVLAENSIQESMINNCLMKLTKELSFLPLIL